MSNHIRSCATSKGSDQPAHTRSLIRAFASMTVKLLTEHHLEFLSLKGGCTYSFRNTIRESSGLDPDSGRRSVAPDIGPVISRRQKSSLAGKELTEVFFAIL